MIISKPLADSTVTPEVATSHWHTMGVDAAIEKFGTSAQAGLKSPEVHCRARSAGPNKLFEKPPRSPWLLLFGQFKNVLILVLMMAAALAASIGKVTDAAVIMVVVLLNAALGFYQQYRAEQSLAARKLRTVLHGRRGARFG